MMFTFRMLFAFALTLMIAGCGGGDNHDHDHGEDHAGHDHDEEGAHGDDHSDAKDLPDATINGVAVKLQQVGAIEAGEEAVLLVKLPASDDGQTIVRAWLGGEDRTLYRVEKGHFVADEGVYDVHVIAPAPLPDNAMWWIEIEKPDGSKAVGSTKPITGS